LALQSKLGDRLGDGTVSSVFGRILKGLATVAAGMALSVLAACGGGGGTTTPPPPPPTYYSLSVTLGTGTSGTPGPAANSYLQGSVVNYTYAPNSGYGNLVVKMDGNVVSNPGSVTMNGPHAIATTASPSGPPTISAQPQNATVEYLAPATFNVIAAASSPLTYQWQRNGVDIPGAAQASYTTSALAFTETGTQFSAVVSCSTGSVASDMATVTVKSPPLDRTPTLAGIDQNQNGVRDDIDAVVARIPVDLSQKQKLEAVARILQTSITGPLASLKLESSTDNNRNKELQTIAQSNMQALSDAIMQVVQSVPQGWKYIYDIRACQYNTKDRVSQRIAEYKLLKGTTWDLTVPEPPVINVSASSLIVPGYSIEYFNGVDNTSEQATQSIGKILETFNTAYRHPVSNKTYRLNYHLCYNPTDGILDDLFEAYVQMTQGNINWEGFWNFAHSMNPDLNKEIFMSKLASRLVEVEATVNSLIGKFVADTSDRINNGWRVLGIAHSQGNLFANSTYDEMLNKHYTTDQFKVVHVAPATNRVVGRYTTWEHDSIINYYLRQIFPSTMPANDFSPSEHPLLDFPGHSFIDIYLSKPTLSEKVIKDIRDALASFPEDLSPQITSFKSIPEVITEGQTVDLLPVFTNATSASIDNGVGTVVSGGTYTVKPTTTPMAFYNLTVNGPGGTTKATTIVTVIPNTDVSITSFTAVPASIAPGHSAVLTPVFINATSATINPGVVGTVTSGTGYTVTPAATTIYTLTANGTHGPVTRTVTVTVTTGSSVSITSFTAAPTSITAGQSAVLTPVFINASSATINPGVAGNVTSGTGYTVTPAATTTYTLTANGTNGPVTRAVTVTVTGGLFSQQGPKLVGMGAAGTAEQGRPVSISADGNTAIVGGRADDYAFADNAATGAAWIWTRAGGVWTQQGTKLVGSGAVGRAYQGASVAISSDGNTALVGGWNDDSGAGAAWVWTRSGGVWTQQGTKLVGSGAVGIANQGVWVSLSADGNTAIVGGPSDNSDPADTFHIGVGAAWVWTRSGGVWTQQGPKLVGSDSSGKSYQGISVSLSSDGNTAIVGGTRDNGAAGAAWVWMRAGVVWTQQGTKLVGSGVTGAFAEQGGSVCLSADGNTAMVGGYSDNSGAGAAWVWTRTGGFWTQQGTKLIGSGAVGNAYQGSSVSLSADGNTAIVGGPTDNTTPGAMWVWKRSGGAWTQQGSKLVGSGSVGVQVLQGISVSLSADGNTAIVGGCGDNGNLGAAWVFTR
jgi:hypothetical protein